MELYFATRVRYHPPNIKPHTAQAQTHWRYESDLRGTAHPTSVTSLAGHSLRGLAQKENVLGPTKINLHAVRQSTSLALPDLSPRPV